MIVFHLQDIYESVEAGARVGRELDNSRLASERFLHRLKHVLPGCLLSVKLIDGHYERHIVLFRISCENLRADLNALLGIHHKDTCIAHLECGNGPAHKIIGARSIYYIEFGIHEFRIERGRIYGPLVGLFYLRIVRNRIAGLHSPSPVDDLAFK